MKKKYTCGVFAIFFVVAVTPAGYKPTMVDSGSGLSSSQPSYPRGSVAAALLEVDAALVNGQYNRALMNVRSLEAQTAGIMLNSGGAQVPAQQNPQPQTPQTELSVGGQTSQTSTPTPIPTPTPSATPTPTPTPSTATPTPSTATDQVPVEAYSQAKFATLSHEIDAVLVPPFSTIADRWSTNQADCVVQFKTQLDATVAWANKYALFFARPEWQQLAKVFYDDVISSWNGITKPIRIRRIGSGIQGVAYKTVYDQVVGALEAIKRSLSGVNQQDITDLQNKILAARDKYAV